jgi:hypothetical protein
MNEEITTNFEGICFSFLVFSLLYFKRDCRDLGLLDIVFCLERDRFQYLHLAFVFSDLW